MKFLGWFFIALPFIAILVLSGLAEGWLMPLVIIGGIAVLGAPVGLGFYLIERAYKRERMR